jgi:hypothetical protein
MVRLNRLDPDVLTALARLVFGRLSVRDRRRVRKLARDLLARRAEANVADVARHGLFTAADPAGRAHWSFAHGIEVDVVDAEEPNYVACGRVVADDETFASAEEQPVSCPECKRLLAEARRPESRTRGYTVEPARA